LATFLVLFAVMALPASAGSGSGFPPPPTCSPGTGPCQETDHFGELAFLASPLPGCPLAAGWAFIDQKGNGVQHINVNGAQDFWFTSTMEGTATIVPVNVVLDSNGNPVSFTPDPTKPTLTGQLQQWFGAEFNNNNFSNSGTVNFQGTSSDGSSVSLHFNIHINTTGMAPFVPNPNSRNFHVTCS
jgi:hypothetical protein